MKKSDLPPAFVTYGWCRTAYTVVHSLGRKGIEVHVGDSSRLAMSRFSRYCRTFNPLPDCFEQPERYFDDVCLALKKTGAKVLMPCHEDVELFAQRRSEMPEGTCVAVPDIESWTTAEDKWSYMAPVSQAGCPVPQTHCVQSASEFESLVDSLTFPVLLKTRIGNSAKGVRICHSKDECRRDFQVLVKRFRLTDDRLPVVQEFIVGPKLGVLGVYNHGKHVSSIVFEIRRSKGASNFGTSTFRVTIDDPVTLQNSIKAMEALNWHGVVDMDWVRGSDGIARLIDINGRLGGATALTCFANMDMPYYWYLIALGKKDFPVATTGINVKARWILGDTIGFVDSLRSFKLRECLRILTPEVGCKHDDLILSDPLPFFAQWMDYGTKFFRAGGSINPVTEGMVR